MALASALALFGSLVLFAIWLMRDRNVAEDRMRAMTPRRETGSKAAIADEPFTQRVMVPAAHALLVRFTELVPTAYIGRARRWLLVSNSTMQVSTFLSLALAAGIVLPALFLLMLAAASGGMPSGRVLLLVPLVALFGFGFPMLVLRRRAMQRQENMLRALPDSLDLLTTCVEAGLSLDYAFQHVAERQQGPVSVEINRMLREKALGQTRRDALTAMAERIDLPDFNVFVQSVIQADTMGTSIAGVLRTQSRQLRIRRRQRAEQAAQQAGPKMVFPLVFFVMPSLFIVVLGPVAISAWDSLGGF
jgi:tight adherence protein C